jgi:hypothetical protein
MPANRLFRYICAVALCLSLMGCSKGPTGPAGPPGPGSRVVYEGIVTAAAAVDGQVISVPSLQLSSFPLVAVYITDEYGDWFQCNLWCMDYTTNPSTINKLEMAYIREGAILLYSGYVGHQYRIVIVK